MNVRDEFSRFYSADELASKGFAEGVVKIAEVVRETARNPQTKQDDEVRVLYLVNRQRGIVLKKTNALSIAEALHNDETDEWAGKRVMMFITQAYRPDKNGPGPVIRFRAAPAATKKQEAEEAVAAAAIDADPVTGEVADAATTEGMNREEASELLRAVQVSWKGSTQQQVFARLGDYIGRPIGTVTELQTLTEAEKAAVEGLINE